MPNHLINENSPYLLQHAKNPVDWYPWSEEALTKAKSENKPIFLSIGYNACHWCHVMEHESFEDDETAALMSENFVNIKVDREERPDIDSIYMQAVVAMCYVGHGVTLATYLGQQMANGILGKAVNNPFADLHIPRAPLYQDKAWFVNAGKVWYRFLDMIK